MRKLERWGYLEVKEFPRYVDCFLYNTEHAGRTDGQTDRQNIFTYLLTQSLTYIKYLYQLRIMK